MVSAPNKTLLTRFNGAAIALVRITLRQELHNEQHEVGVSVVFQLSGSDYRKRFALADDDSVTFQSSTSVYVGIVGFPPPQFVCGISVKRNQLIATGNIADRVVVSQQHRGSQLRLTYFHRKPVLNGSIFGDAVL